MRFSDSLNLLLSLLVLVLAYHNYQLTSGSQLQDSPDILEVRDEVDPPD